MAKRNELTLDQKVRVLEALETRNQIQVASEFGISQSAVSRIRSRESDIIQRWQEMPDRKRTRRTRYSDMLDVSLVRFYESQRIAGIPITTKMLKERANLIVDDNKTSGSEAGLLTSQGGSFEASDSWLSRWKHRHNLDLQRSNRSAGYFVGSKKPSAFSIISQFKELVDEEGYLVTGENSSTYTAAVQVAVIPWLKSCNILLLRSIQAINCKDVGPGVNAEKIKTVASLKRLGITITDRYCIHENVERTEEYCLLGYDAD